MVGRKKEKNIVFFLSHRIGIMLLIFEYIRFENDADVSYNEFLVDFMNTLDVKNKPVLQNILQGDQVETSVVSASSFKFSLTFLRHHKEV